jgi:hypothetical protein
VLFEGVSSRFNVVLMMMDDVVFCYGILRSNESNWQTRMKGNVRTQKQKQRNQFSSFLFFWTDDCQTLDDVSGHTWSIL